MKKSFPRLIVLIATLALLPTLSSWGKGGGSSGGTNGPPPPPPVFAQLLNPDYLSPRTNGYETTHEVPTNQTGSNSNEPVASQPTTITTPETVSYEEDGLTNTYQCLMDTFDGSHDTAIANYETWSDYWSNVCKTTDAENEALNKYGDEKALKTLYANGGMKDYLAKHVGIVPGWRIHSSGF